MTVPSRERLLEMLTDADLGKRLVVTPVVDPDRQIGDGCIDIRLGNQFVVTKTARVGQIEPYARKRPTSIERYQETLYVPFGRELWMHPGTFVLGGTFEYLRLPPHVCADVTARSSWARLGLSIASALAVHPGFYGCLTLELVNNGNTPVAIHPGDRIGQLTVYEVYPDADLGRAPRGKYQGQINPGYSSLQEERHERRRWEALGRKLKLVPK